MAERRGDPRLLCAELVQVSWEENQRVRRIDAVLEDISHSGICLQSEIAIPEGTPVRVKPPRGQELPGIIRYCHFREIGYFCGVEFADGVRWQEELYQPEHLLDPRTVDSAEPPVRSANDMSKVGRR